jgi:hypothetical protein
LKTAWRFGVVLHGDKNKPKVKPSQNSYREYAMSLLLKKCSTCKIVVVPMMDGVCPSCRNVSFSSEGLLSEIASLTDGDQFKAASEINNPFMSQTASESCVKSNPPSLSGDEPKECPVCGLTNPATSHRCDCGSIFKAPSEPRFEVTLTSGECKSYCSETELHDDIFHGLIPRSAPACRIDSNENSRRSVRKWSTVERLASSDAKLRALYRPVWSYTLRYLLYGSLVGIVLKCIDTSITLFVIDAKLGLVWLGCIGSLLVSKKWPAAPVIAIVAAVSVGVRCNLFMTILGTMLVGFSIGGPLGMIVGTIMGHVRKRSIPTAPDAVSEGNKPLIWGLVAPALFLSTWIPLYVMLSIKAIEWLQRSSG